MCSLNLFTQPLRGDQAGSADIAKSAVYLLLEETQAEIRQTDLKQGYCSVQYGLPNQLFGCRCHLSSHFPLNLAIFVMKKPKLTLARTKKKHIFRTTITALPSNIKNKGCLQRRVPTI